MTKGGKAFINLVLTSNILLWIRSVYLEGESFTGYIPCSNITCIPGEDFHPLLKEDKAEAWENR